MLTYDLKVGYRCNNDCVHCVIADSREQLVRTGLSIDLSLAECLAQLDEASRKGAKRIVLTGGEVTLRGDFAQLVARCVQLGMFISLQTNGTMLSHGSVIDTLRSVDTLDCIVAIHGPDAATHDAITRRPGSFGQTVRGIAAVVGVGRRVTGKIVISRLNVAHLAEIMPLLKSLGVRYASIAFPHAQGNARANFESVVPRYREIQNSLEELVDSGERNGVRIEFEAVPFCIIPKHPQLVGELQYLGNDRTVFVQVRESVLDWNDVRKAIKCKAGTCNACFYDSICEGPWEEYVDRFGSAELTPISGDPVQLARLVEIVGEIHDSEANL